MAKSAEPVPRQNSTQNSGNTTTKCASLAKHHTYNSPRQVSICANMSPRTEPRNTTGWKPHPHALGQATQPDCLAARRRYTISRRRWTRMMLNHGSLKKQPGDPQSKARGLNTRAKHAGNTQPTKNERFTRSNDGRSEAQCLLWRNTTGRPLRLNVATQILLAAAQCGQL